LRIAADAAVGEAVTPPWHSEPRRRSRNPLPKHENRLRSGWHLDSRHLLSAKPW